MAEFDNLLEAYFTSKDTDDPENERIALEVVEKVVQELEDNLKNEEDFNEAKLYQSIKKYLSENDADKNKRVAIYFLNDLERQLKHKGYADESSGIDFNYLLYEFGKNDYSVIDQYFDIFNVDNVIRMIFGSPYLSEKQKYHLLDKAKLEQEQWNILYFNFKSRDMGFDDKEFNDMLSYLSLKAAGQAAGEAAEKEIIDNNWTEVSLNQYIQQGASSSALGLIAALNGQIKAYEFLANKLNDEEHRDIVDKALYLNGIGNASDPEYKFIKHLITRQYSLDMPLKASYAYDEKHEQTLLSLALRHDQDELYKILIERSAVITEETLSDIVLSVLHFHHDDFLMSLIQTNKTTLENVFKLIYSEKAEKQKSEILTFIQTHYPEFIPQEELLNKAITLFLKGKEVNAILQCSKWDFLLSKENINLIINLIIDNQLDDLLKELYNLKIINIEKLLESMYEKVAAPKLIYKLILFINPNFTIPDNDINQFLTFAIENRLLDLIKQYHTHINQLPEDVLLKLLDYFVDIAIDESYKASDYQFLYKKIDELTAQDKISNEMFLKLILDDKNEMNRQTIIKICEYLNLLDVFANHLNFSEENARKIFDRIFEYQDLVIDVDNIPDFADAFLIIIKKGLNLKNQSQERKKVLIELAIMGEDTELLEYLIEDNFITRDKLFRYIYDEHYEEHANFIFDCAYKEGEQIEVTDEEGCLAILALIEAFKYDQKKSAGQIFQIISYMSIGYKKLNLTYQQRSTLLEKLLNQILENEGIREEMPNEMQILLKNLIESELGVISISSQTLNKVIKVALLLGAVDTLDLLLLQEVTSKEDIFNMIDTEDLFLSQQIYYYIYNQDRDFKMSLPVGQRALECAIKNNNREIVEWLIAAGVNPAYQDSEPLKLAILSDNPSLDIVNVLLDSGADPKAQAYTFSLEAIEKVIYTHNLSQEQIDIHYDMIEVLLLKTFPGDVEAIRALFEKQHENDNRERIDEATVYNFIYDRLNPVQKAAMSLIKIKRQIEKWEDPETAGTVSQCSRANKHFEEVVEPHLRARFEETKGNSELEKIENIESRLKLAILDKMIDTNKDDPNHQQFVRFIQENKALLVQQQNINIGKYMLELANSNTDNSQIAWRAYDPNAPFDPTWPNLLTPQRSGDAIYNIHEAGGNIAANDASYISRKRVAYYFLALENNEINVENFFQQIADIRRAHYHPTLDSPSCYPGTIGRIGEMGAGNKKLQLPPDRRKIILGVINAMIISKFSEKLETLSPIDAMELYNSLIMMSMKTASDIVENKNKYQKHWLILRQKFINELEIEADTVGFGQINLKLEEHREPRLGEKDYNFLGSQFLDIGANNRANEMYDRMCPKKEEPEVDPGRNQIANPFVFSLGLILRLPPAIQNKQVDKMLKQLIEFELLIESTSPYLKETKSESIRTFIKTLTEEIVALDNENVSASLADAFNLAFNKNKKYFTPEEKQLLLTHREDILAQSLFNGLNEERVEKIYALLKEKLNLSNDAKFKDLIDRRFSQICDNLPKLPPADKNKPESSDYKKKGRI